MLEPSLEQTGRVTAPLRSMRLELSCRRGLARCIACPAAAERHSLAPRRRQVALVWAQLPPLSPWAGKSQTAVVLEQRWCWTPLLEAWVPARVMRLPDLVVSQDLCWAAAMLVLALAQSWCWAKVSPRRAAGRQQS